MVSVHAFELLLDLCPIHRQPDDSTPLLKLVYREAPITVGVDLLKLMEQIVKVH